MIWQHHFHYFSMDCSLHLLTSLFHRYHLQLQPIQILESTLGFHSILFHHHSHPVDPLIFHLDHLCSMTDTDPNFLSLSFLWPTHFPICTMVEIWSFKQVDFNALQKSLERSPYYLLMDTVFFLQFLFRYEFFHLIS